MFNKVSKYSYADQRKYSRKLWKIILRVAVLMAVYILITNILFPVMFMKSRSMQPSVMPGDRIIFSTFDFYSVRNFFAPGSGGPYKRGSVVLVEPYTKKVNLFVSAADRLVRFFTAGKAGIPGGGRNLFLKRVIGLPGDEITMTSYVIKIHPAGSPYTLTEYELSEKPYNVSIPQVSALRDDSLPFSGNMDKITLTGGECFVISDDRSNTNDSRTWGPVSVKSIKGTAVFRYWPLNRLGFP